MALQTFKCPNCNGELQMDDGLEKGYCMYCGSTIHVKEEVAKIKIELSGKVEIDDTKRFENTMTLADRAFDIGNYGESYNYYCSALECRTDDAHAVFRKGLCAAYISFTRVGELEQGIRTALEINRAKDKGGNESNHLIFTELLAYIDATSELDCERPKGFVYPSLAAVNNTFSTIAVLTRLSSLCAEIISEEMMAAQPAYEEDKRSCLELGITICKRGTVALKYVAGTKQVQKGGSFVTESIYKTVKSPALEMQKKYLVQLKDQFNDLPTTRKTLARYDGELAQLQQDVDAFDQGLEAYFEENPAIRRAYNRTPLPFVIATGVAFLLILLVGGLVGSTASDDILGMLLVLLVLMFVGFGVYSVIRLISHAKKRKSILDQLPPELAELKVTHDESLEKMKGLQRSRAAFVNKNLKR